MDAAELAFVLQSQGFERFGAVTFRLRIDAWWHPADRLHLLLLDLGDSVLLRGSKPYYLTSVSPDGQTWARDIPALHDWLEHHTPELHLSMSYLRDVPPSLAARHRMSRRAASGAQEPSVEALAAIQARVRDARAHHGGAQRLAGLDSGDFGLLSTHLRQQAEIRQRELREAEAQEAEAVEQVGLERHLQAEYLRKGCALSLVFSLGSNVQAAHAPAEAGDAAAAIRAELRDAHRFQVSQKLNGGKLGIHVEESEEPALVWLEQWWGGALAPAQLERLLSDTPHVRDRLNTHLQVTTVEDVRADGHVVEEAKLVAPRAVSALVDRLDRSDKLAAAHSELPRSALPLRVEKLVASGQPTSEPCVLPLARFNNGYLSGSTGSGKSYHIRVIAEEASEQPGLGVLVLDPRNQSAGLLVAEDRPKVLARGEAPRSLPPRGYRFEYAAPGHPRLQGLPRDLGELAGGHHIVSFKALDEHGRCVCFAEVLDAVFETSAREEASRLRLLILIEEAQLFTRRHVDESARSGAERAEVALDRLLREGRKYGICTLVSSQSVKDFSHAAAGIRQNCNTKIFMHNSDRELEYARDYVDHPRELVGLPSGTAIACNPAWGAVRYQVRSPRSKVWEFSDADTAAIVAGQHPAVPVQLSPDAVALEALVSRRHGAGEGGLNVTEAGRLLGLTSKRRLLAVVDELEQAGRIWTRRLSERGRPRVLEPQSASGSSDSPRTESGPEPDATGRSRGNCG